MKKANNITKREMSSSKGNLVNVCWDGFHLKIGGLGGIYLFNGKSVSACNLQSWVGINVI